MASLLRRAVSAYALWTTLAWSRAFATSAEALKDCGIYAGLGPKCKEGLRDGSAISFETIPAVIRTATEILLGLTGTVSVVAIIFGGFKYVIGSSQGDTTKGKEALIYGIVGFIVSAMAWFIVKLVLGNL